MSTIAQTLTVAKFEAQYSHHKPYFEFWHGQAIQKAAATIIHGLLQQISAQLLVRAGFKAASEVKLKIDPDFHPVPDVIATRSSIKGPYPREAWDVIVEILSADDPMTRILTKCRAYQTWGFKEIYVVDPGDRVVFCWTPHGLEEVQAIAGEPVSQMWIELEKALQ